MPKHPIQVLLKDRGRGCYSAHDVLMKTVEIDADKLADVLESAHQKFMETENQDMGYIQFMAEYTAFFLPEIVKEASHGNK